MAREDSPLWIRDARSDREKANPALQIYKAVRAFRSDVLAVAGEIIKNAEEVSVQI